MYFFFNFTFLQFFGHEKKWKIIENFEKISLKFLNKNTWGNYFIFLFYQILLFISTKSGPKFSKT